MEQLAIEAGLRTKLTKCERNRIRREGGVPGILYGPTITSTPIVIHPESLKKIVARKGHGLVELNLSGETVHAMIRHMEREPINRKVLHIDLYAVSMDQMIDVEVPIYLNGLEEVEKRDAIIQQQMREVILRTRPMDIPDQILVDISWMHAGDNLRVRDLPIPSGSKLISDLEEVVVGVIPADNAEPDTEIVPKEPELVHDTEGQGVGAHEIPGAHE
ncbi:50S ribosomal protein L25 [Effusibacillus dendaii]|uniref:Large ribosomal subunit protein bL25 n=1 Tax=Effusibacillus dendaii TaxID=2743772 RepID=A0A7I8DHV2_9BACL|nr:50S ribosomal protein L25 [Effusibacillus dendaii]BCJ87411.1 50S ribosomal protein L25 [Effusibacillus dendaii]